MLIGQIVMKELSDDCGEGYWNEFDTEEQDRDCLRMDDLYGPECWDGDDLGQHEKRGVRNRRLGSRGEEAAARYLEHMDYEILERNWTCPAGEADIIARQGRTVVFVEVKTRTGIEKGLPAEAVTSEKRARYERIAAYFLRDYEDIDIPFRFDVIGLQVVAPNRALIKHYVNAFGSGW